MKARFVFVVISLLVGLVQPIRAERIYDFWYSFDSGPSVYGSISGERGADDTCGAYVYNVTVLDAFYSGWEGSWPMNLPLTFTGWPPGDPGPARMYFEGYCNEFALIGTVDYFHMHRPEPSNELLAVYHRRATPEQAEVWARDYFVLGRWWLTERPVSVEQLLSELRQRVIGVGPGRSLSDKILHAQAYYAAKDVVATCGMLAAFINEVEAQSGKKIATSLVGDLVDDASEIRSEIVCE